MKKKSKLHSFIKDENILYKALRKIKLVGHLSKFQGDHNQRRNWPQSFKVIHEPLGCLRSGTIDAQLIGIHQIAEPTVTSLHFHRTYKLRFARQY